MMYCISTRCINEFLWLELIYVDTEYVDTFMAVDHVNSASIYMKPYVQSEAQGRSTEIISMIQKIRTSRLSMKKSLSAV